MERRIEGVVPVGTGDRKDIVMTGYKYANLLQYKPKTLDDLHFV